MINKERNQFIIKGSKLSNKNGNMGRMNLSLKKEELLIKVNMDLSLNNNKYFQKTEDKTQENTDFV